MEDFEKQALELVVIHERNDTDMDDNILAEGSVAFGNMVKTGYVSTHCLTIACVSVELEWLLPPCVYAAVEASSL